MNARTTTATVAALALLASGCAGAKTAPAGGSGAGQATSSVGVVAAAPATDPCAGIADCTEVARVDADGDGNPDRVGVTVLRAPGDSGVTVSVLIATGSTVKRIDVQSPGALPGNQAQPQPYVGAYRISRTTGSDLVLHTELGQGNAEQFVVIGWTAGNPTLVASPPDSMTNQSDPGVWYTSSSHGVQDSVTCTDGAAITMNKLSAAVEEGMPVPGGGIRQQDHFTFDGSQWQPNGSENVADSSFSYNFDPQTQTFRCQDQALK
jgi:hypothetical protein